MTGHLYLMWDRMPAGSSPTLLLLIHHLDSSRRWQRGFVPAVGGWMKALPSFTDMTVYKLYSVRHADYVYWQGMEKEDDDSDGYTLYVNSLYR